MRLGDGLNIRVHTELDVYKMAFEAQMRYSGSHVDFPKRSVIL